VASVGEKKQDNVNATKPHSVDKASCDWRSAVNARPPNLVFTPSFVHSR